jgi:thiosulfate/3-mercaptopyruvate sulfurtransferase
MALLTDPSDRRAHALRTPSWLEAHLDDPTVRVVDGSFHLPGAGRDARAEFRDRHIPGAAFFDIDAIRDETSDLPHMLPTPEGFAAAMTALGIGPDDTVIAYDAPGSAAAPRVWWTFRAFGHGSVAILDGGLTRWLAEGRPTVSGPPKPSTSAPYPVRTRNPALVRSLAQMLDLVTDRCEQVIDNRSPGRFNGVEPEPRAARHLGHIPGSINIPFGLFTDPARHGTWRSDDDIAAVFAEAGVDPRAPMVGTCGSGVTACTTAFAAWLLSNDRAAVYDGSWAEWGNRDETPIER